MLAQKFRFHGHGSLRWVFRKGKPLRSRHLVLRYVTNPHRNQPRVAIIVSKKVLKSAVKRNRVRRRLFEIVRHRLNSIPPSTDIVITVFSSEVLDMSHDKIDQELSSLLAQTAVATDDNTSKS